MITVNNLSYIHPNRDILFENIGLIVNLHEKIALVGNNGIGKSSLLKVMAGELKPTSGNVECSFKTYYVPQHIGQYNSFTVAEALRIDLKLKALRNITDGNASEEDLNILNDDWLLEERCGDALSKWGMEGIDLSRGMNTLSGGQKTKVFLSGIGIHKPDVVLLDEPSNHLDMDSRNILYDYIRHTLDTLVVVSHDRTLLNLLNKVCELSKHGISVYGGDYDFYADQKQIESESLQNDIMSNEKALRKAKQQERESLERKQRADARGKKKQEKSGLPRILLNTFRNNAENSASKIKDVHAEKILGIVGELNELRKDLPDIDKMKIDLNNSSLHRGKKLITAENINGGFNGVALWHLPLSFQITSGERVVIKGANGSGKTTLIKFILGELQPVSGSIERVSSRSVYIDQEYSLINNSLSVYEQVQQFNTDNLEDHEIKIRLNRFLFTKDNWDKACKSLSGGEKMRLTLCCLMVSNQAPDIVILDEPTNNLDIQNIGILITAISDYKGTLIVVSHDQYFLQQMNIDKTIELK